jgi:anti-sigma factor RsiW
VNPVCADLQAALRGDDPELTEAFARHAEGCPDCRLELALWKEISAAAPSLRKSWASPELEGRIRADLRAEARAKRRIAPVLWLPLAAAAALVLALGARSWLNPGLRPERREAATAPIVDEAQQRLLTEQALSEVEHAEDAYARSIDALSKLAEPRLRDADSSVLANYREKLLLLDAAIADCRAQAERNRFNAHLRLELLSIYQEKQRTLESLLKEDIHAL